MLIDGHSEWFIAYMIGFLSFVSVQDDHSMRSLYILDDDIDFETQGGLISSNNALMIVCLDFYYYLPSHWEMVIEKFGHDFLSKIEEISDIIFLSDFGNIYSLSDLDRPVWRVMRMLAQQALTLYDPSYRASPQEVKEWFGNFIGSRP